MTSLTRSAPRPRIRPAILELIARRETHDAEDAACADAFLAQLRAIVAGAETPFDRQVRRYARDRGDRLGSILARHRD